MISYFSKLKMAFWIFYLRCMNFFQSFDFCKCMVSREEIFYLFVFNLKTSKRFCFFSIFERKDSLFFFFFFFFWKQSQKIFTFLQKDDFLSFVILVLVVGLFKSFRTKMREIQTKVLKTKRKITCFFPLANRKV